MKRLPEYLEERLEKVWETEGQLLYDEVIYGNSFYTTDEFGIKTRIDPKTVMPKSMFYNTKKK